MSSKKKKSKSIDDAADQSSAEANEDLTVSASAGKDAPAPDPEETSSLESSTSDSSPDASMDDLLDDVRRSLIEDESVEVDKQPKWWQRLGKGLSKEEARPEEADAVNEIRLPAIDDVEPDEKINELESDAYLEQIDELIDLLEDEPPVEEIPARSPVQELPVEPEKAIDIEELKKQAFQPRPDADEPEVRNIALDGDEDMFVEVEAKPQDPFEDRLKAIENSLQPYRRYINFAIAFLGVVIALITMTILYNIYQQARPEPVVEATPSLPFPTSVSLPGGWVFNLGRGTLKNGSWKPQGAEWLEGTEVCRWVSLPWSRQLEAVLRTLNPDDPIELGMSNSDILVYQVYSMRQMTLEEMQQLDSNSPCLLIMLADDNAEKRWVLTAMP